MNIEELMQQAEQLSPEQQLQFVALLVERIRQRYPAERSRPRWRDLQGSAPYPLAGEDAQAWVSRTRQEGGEHSRLPLLSVGRCPEDFLLRRENIYGDDDR